MFARYGISNFWKGMMSRTVPPCTRPRVYSLRNSVPAASFNSISVPYLGSSWRRRVCLLYNRESTPGCSFSNCRFEHICCLCADDPHATYKRHKAVVCPHHSTFHPMASHLRKHDIHPGFTTDLTATTNEYPQLHRESMHQRRQTFL